MTVAKPFALSCWTKRSPCWSWSRSSPKSRGPTRWRSSWPAALQDQGGTWSTIRWCELVPTSPRWKPTLCLRHVGRWAWGRPACPQGCQPLIAPRTWVVKRWFQELVNFLGNLTFFLGGPQWVCRLLPLDCLLPESLQFGKYSVGKLRAYLASLVTFFNIENIN